VLECYRRADSIVPQQALALENSAIVTTQAAKIAERIYRDLSAKGDATDEKFVNESFRRILGSEATAEELSICLEDVSKLRSIPGNNDSRIRTALVLALLNHNDFITVR